MKVRPDHYMGFETIEYNGNSYKVPLGYEGYLTAKYGDWSEPVKEWNCAIHEKTVISRAV